MANFSNSLSPYPRIVLAGTHSGCGKTTVTTALMSALTKMKITVFPFKVGPDYIDPSFHTIVTGNPSRNLDSWLIEPKQIQHLFFKSVSTATYKIPTVPDKMAIIEGVMGLYDGQGNTSKGSTAELARRLEAPILLILDGKGMSLSAAALVKGFSNFEKNISISGVIVNNITSERHYQILKQCIEKRTGILCVGYFPQKKEYTFHRRHLGLIPQNEIKGFKQLTEKLADQAIATLDIDTILSIASTYKEPKKLYKTVASKSPEQDTPHYPKNSIRIGIALDNAFSFYYKDNLELLEELGAKLVYFSPLEDKKLPQTLQGLYLGGGFPEVFAQQLSNNKSFLSSIFESLNGGIPAYAECGGLLYLMEKLQDVEKKTYPMVGFFEGKAIMTPHLQTFGYISVTLSNDTPLGSEGTSFRAHEFHHSQVETTSTPIYTACKENGTSWKGGLLYKNVFGGYPHIHFYSNKQLAKNFLNSCMQ